MSDAEFLIDEIDFGQLEMGFEDNSFETVYYLDIEDNVLLMFSEYGGPPPDDYPDREQVEMDTTGRFVKVPRGDSDEAWRDMREFAFSLDDEELSDRLWNVIQGSGAFRRFKDLVFEAGIRDEWSDFQARRIRERVLDWLRGEDLITEKQRKEYMEKLEEGIRRREQFQRDMTNMNEGATVECRDPGGYPGLSEGIRYDVVGERPDDSLVRINDDNDSRSWYAKTLFDLIRDE